MLAGFFEWWLRQIRSLPVGRRRAGLPNAVIFAIDELRLEPALAAAGNVLIRRDGREVQTAMLSLPHQDPVAALPALPPGLRAGLRLPAGMMLRRDVALPMAAARDLTQLLTFEMDRLTPFTADELLWSTGPAQVGPAQLGPRGPSANRESLKFSLLMVPRRPVEALLTALDQAGLRPAFVECENGRIELRRHATPRQNGQRAVWALCGALALACLVAPVIRQQLALNDAAGQIAALQPAMGEAQTLRARFAAATAAQTAVTTAQQKGDALRSLAVLTNALPDGTWLTDLTLSAGNLTINGQSQDAAALIAVLAATPAFHDPRFIAPVTRAPGGDADLFSINATVTP
jgi:general secretion pathway protein L